MAKAATALGGGERLTKGERTRARLVAAAEEVFGEGTYDEASIVEITRRAGVSQGTFYLYFPSKLDVFREVVRDLGHQLRTQIAIAVESAPTRADVERRGFRAFFAFVEAHPELYRIIRQAEFVDRESFQAHYRKLAEGYTEGLAAAMASGEVRRIDPEVLAYCLMGIGEILGMRWILWDRSPSKMPPAVVEQMIDFVVAGLHPTSD